MQTHSTLIAVLLTAALLPHPAAAATREEIVVESATGVLADLNAIPERCIPPVLLRDARAVAVIPNVIKAGFVIGGSHGRGILCLREADGSWANPIFISLTAGSVGWQVGVQSTDVVLVFRTRRGLERVLEGKGKLTLGADAAVAAGPVGRRAEAATDVQLKAEIFSYSRSRGLFAGVSLEGAGLAVDCLGNELFYRIRGGLPADVVAFRGAVPVVIAPLRAELARMSALPGPAVEFGAPVPVPPQPLPPPRPLPPQPRLTPTPAPVPPPPRQP